MVTEVMESMRVNVLRCMISLLEVMVQSDGSIFFVSSGL
jgi:hypothetical protein